MISASKAEEGTTYMYSNSISPRDKKISVRTSSPRFQMLLKLPDMALGSYFQFFDLRPFDIDDRPTQGADDLDKPRSAT